MKEYNFKQHTFRDCITVEGNQIYVPEKVVWTLGNPDFPVLRKLNVLIDKENKAIKLVQNNEGEFSIWSNRILSVPGLKMPNGKYKRKEDNIFVKV